MNDVTGQLAQNQYFVDLFGTLREYGKDTDGLSALLDYVDSMEKFVVRAEDKIADMKSQLEDMREVQDHPIKTALQKAVKSFESAVSSIKEQLSDMKADIIEGCKQAMAAFKENGITVLDKLASFFHIKDGLQIIKNDTVKAVGKCDKAIADIDTFSKEYHTAGRAIKNMARMAIGKKPIDAQKEAGKLAKAVSAPYRANKKCMLGIRGAVNNALDALTRLENKAAEIHAERALTKKPSMLKKLEANLERVAREKEIAAPERALAQGHEV